MVIGRSVPLGLDAMLLDKAEYGEMAGRGSVQVLPEIAELSCLLKHYNCCQKGMLGQCRSRRTTLEKPQPRLQIVM
jgi:hypothetical protein